ncbi:MAG: N-acetylmuramoyl-L-alanine amidase [Planctomycetota bacterium]|jgi:N-acetyl-anhydromuramyl-L-alanine amidase AmpD
MPSDMRILDKPLSLNFDSTEIDVEFIVIHYSGGNFADLLRFFEDPQRKVSAHFAIDENGDVYNLVRSDTKKTYRAWHAGYGRFYDGVKEWQNFNDFSIGIELVNRNGNILPYKEPQYISLTALINHLKQLHTELNDPNRVVGHEHISGWRGKADPGLFFDWSRIFRECYPGLKQPERVAVCPPALGDAFRALVDVTSPDTRRDMNFWFAVNRLMETVLSNFHNETGSQQPREREAD